MAKHVMRQDLSGLPGWPLMHAEAAAAAFISLPPEAFRRTVVQGDMPAPPRVADRWLWSRRDIEARLDPTGAAASADHNPVAAAIARAG